MQNEPTSQLEDCLAEGPLLQWFIVEGGEGFAVRCIGTSACCALEVAAA